MSQSYVLSSVLPYLRDTLDSLGYMEHVDEFDDTNISSTILDKTYVLRVGNLSTTGRDHISYSWLFPVTVEIFFKVYKNISSEIDGVLNSCEDFLDECLDISTLDSLPFTGLRPDGIELSTISSSNDTVIKATINLVATVNMYNDKNC